MKALSDARPNMNKGYPAVLAGYIGWGLFPLYWVLLDQVPPLEILLYRMLWAAPILILLVAFNARAKTQVTRALHNWPEIRLLAVSSLFICLNWGIFIWAVAN